MGAWFGFFENRIANSFMGVSSQPSVGGPTYFVRNVMYNVVFESFKLHNGTVGDVLLHNTVIKSGDAFAVFTEEVDLWWVRGPINHHAGGRMRAMRCEPGVGGRLRHHAATTRHKLDQLSRAQLP